MPVFLCLDFIGTSKTRLEIYYTQVYSFFLKTEMLLCFLFEEVQSVQFGQSFI